PWRLDHRTSQEGPNATGDGRIQGVFVRPGWNGTPMADHGQHGADSPCCPRAPENEPASRTGGRAGAHPSCAGPVHPAHPGAAPVRHTRARMTVPAISVLMPAYNAAEHIEQSIGSLLQQTFTEFEIIVVDDGSTDDTWHIVGSISDSRIRLIQNPRNMGVVWSG